MILNEIKNSIVSILITLLFIGCTTNNPGTVGAIGGAAAGAGIGAIVASNSSKISNFQGIGYGALIGIPVGILVAHASDATAKYYTLSENDSDIETNKRIIFYNQKILNERRSEVAFERPRGNPDPDNAEYIYVGPTLGNVWR